MNERISNIRSLYVANVVGSSILNVGDAGRFSPKTYVFALQRQRSDFDDEEAPLSMFPIYFEPIPEVTPYEHVTMTVSNEDPFIQVDQIYVMSVSTSSAMFAGSCEQMKLESRTKHIRHFLNPPPTESDQSIPYHSGKLTGIIL